MTQPLKTKTMWTRTALALAVVTWLAAGCSGKKEQEEQECVDPPPEANAGEKKTVKLERFGLGKAGDEGKEQKDWCRACVMSKVGYASCQRVFADKEGEDRDTLRKRARDKACVDAKFEADACPEEAVINIQCKGDVPPPGTPDPGTALQNLYKKMGGGQPKVQVNPRPAGEAEGPAEGPAKADKPKPAVE